MSNYVYVIVNKINLKLYFGSHCWKGEGLDPYYYGSGIRIKEAVRKYGRDNFIVYPIKFYDNVEECRKAEEELLTRYDIKNNPYCYNMKNSATGGEKIQPLSEEMKRKIAERLDEAEVNMLRKRYEDMVKKDLTNQRNTEENCPKYTQIKKTPIVAIQLSTGRVRMFKSQMECSEVLEANPGHIYNCLKGRQKTCKGYLIKYLEQLESGIYEGFTGSAE